MRANTALGQKRRSAQLSLRIDWDDRRKRWDVTCTVLSPLGVPRVMTMSADTTAAVDDTSARILLAQVVRTLEAMLPL